MTGPPAQPKMGWSAFLGPGEGNLCGHEGRHSALLSIYNGDLWILVLGIRNIDLKEMARWHETATGDGTGA